MSDEKTMSENQDSPSENRNIEAHPSTTWKRLVRLAIPLALAQLGQNLMGLVDTAFLGRVSPEALGAAGIGNGLFFAIVVLPMGIILGSETLISQCVGAKKDREAGQTVRQALWLGTVLFVPTLIVILVCLESVPYWGIDEPLVLPTQEYGWARTPGAFAFFAYFALRCYVQGYGRTLYVTMAVVIANIINVPLNGLLIFGDEGLLAIGLPALGLKAYGVWGAGLSSSICTFVQVLVIWPETIRIYRTHLNSPLTKDLLAKARSDCFHQRMKSIVQVGLPVGMQFTVEVGLFSLVGILMGKLGSVTAAAHQVAITVASTSFHAVLGISMATSVLVGQNIGANDSKGAFNTGLVGLTVGGLFMGGSATIYYCFPEFIASLFSSQLDVIAETVVLLQIAAVFQLFDGGQAIASGALRGAGDTRWAFGVNFVAHWAFGLPFAIIMGFYFDRGATGMWWGITLGLGIAAVGLMLRFIWKGQRGYSALIQSEPNS